MQLTKNFHMSEFKCPCGCTLEPQNKFIKQLQELRDLVGLPLIVSPGGGVRCKSYNESRGRKYFSYHRVGRAADISCPQLTLMALYELVQNTKIFSGVGFYPQNNFIHVDNRHKKARWSRIDGVYVSIDEGIKYYGEVK
jgi:uncharacterized protein YcbK (DUF882 family)